MLSREMLHMLLRFEYILASSTQEMALKKADGIKCNTPAGYRLFNQQCPNVASLMGLKPDFLELWGSTLIQREELIVILGGIYTMGTKTFILGETKFLREHYVDQNVISCTHALFEAISNQDGRITHRRFLDNAFQPDCIARCLEVFPLKN